MEIKTWVERCNDHPDHQTGMVSEGMIRARMEEEIEDLRAKVEELSDQIYESIPKWQSNEMQREINRLRDARTVIERERDRARAEIERLRQAHQTACEGGDLLSAEIMRLTRERNEARAEVGRLREVLRDALNGLQYWCPQSSAGAVERSRIMARGEKALEAKP